MICDTEKQHSDVPGSQWCVYGERHVFESVLDLRNMKRRPKPVLCVGQRYIRWTSVDPKLGQCVVFTGHVIACLITQQTQDVESMLF